MLRLLEDFMYDHHFFGVLFKTYAPNGCYKHLSLVGSLHTTSAASSGFFTSFSQSSHSLAHLSKDQATSSSTSLTIESSGKSHKAKKKKKKNKHKHKHKHKHERGDRDHHSERRDRDHHSEKREKGRERDRNRDADKRRGRDGSAGLFLGGNEDRRREGVGQREEERDFGGGVSFDMFSSGGSNNTSPVHISFADEPSSSEFEVV